MKRLIGLLALCSLGLAACSSSPEEMDGGSMPDVFTPRVWNVISDGPSVAGLTLSAHWSPNGGQAGELAALGTFPASGQFVLDLPRVSGLESQRQNLSDIDGLSGTMSFAWLVVEDAAGDIIAASLDTMLVEITEPATADSFLGQLLNSETDLAAGVHVIQVREYSAAEEAEITMCLEAGGTEITCPALDLHVEVAEVRAIVLSADDGNGLPDLS